MISDYEQCDATELAGRIRRGELAASEVVEEAITRIERVNPALNAVVHRMYDRARATLPQLADGPFKGVPLVVKDFDGYLKGEPWTGSCRLLEGYVPDHDSEAIARLRRGGLVFLAKTNLPELAILGTTEPAWRGASRNPWNVDHSTGGSSGGSAALVAARAVPVGHGGDGGGSLRIPASHCGLVGFKATRGRIPVGPDQGEGWGGYVSWGVLTRSVRDAAAFTDLLAGPMPGDPYHAPPLERALALEVGHPPGKLKIGFTARSLYGKSQHPDVVSAVNATARALADLGHEVEEAHPELDREALVMAYLTQVAVGTAGEVEDFGRRVGKTPSASMFEPATWFLVQMGRAMSALDLLRARDAAATAGRVMAAYHARYDVMLTASAAYPAVKIGELALKPAERVGLGLLRAAPVGAVLRKVLEGLADTNLERTPNTQLFNQTGQPAISLPLHTSADGLPIGVQLSAPLEGEGVLFRLASQLEQSSPWIGRFPRVR